MLFKVINIIIGSSTQLCSRKEIILPTLECVSFVINFYFIFSVPSFKNLPEETISKIADVLEEVSELFIHVVEEKVKC